MSFVGNLVYEIFYVMYMWSYGHFYKPKWYRITTRWDTKRDLAINVLLCITTHALYIYLFYYSSVCVCIYNQLYTILAIHCKMQNYLYSSTFALIIVAKGFLLGPSIHLLFLLAYTSSIQEYKTFYFELVIKTRLCFRKVQNTFTCNTIVCQTKYVEIYGSSGIITFVH